MARETAAERKEKREKIEAPTPTETQSQADDLLTNEQNDQSPKG